MNSLFGTDGVRGTANVWPMLPGTIVQLATASVSHFMQKYSFSENSEHRFTVVIGKDTRLSGYMVESSLVAGFVAMGAHVILLGPLPTPAVAMLTRSLRAHLGVMISASHNPYYDNGIKFFQADGYKITKEDEAIITSIIDGSTLTLAAPTHVGKAKRLDDALGRYIEFAKATFPKGNRLDGLKIVVDCAHGAAYKVAPRVLWELGADVIAINVDPNGLNINAGCGATDVKMLQMAVVENKAHLGIALDGDADRLMMVDEEGTLIDGDQLMAVIAKVWHSRGQLTGQGIVATHMSNLGLERYLEKMGLTLHRASVGDRAVLEMMRHKGCNVGGEQSGHIVLSDFATTGDGLIAALQVLSFVQANKCPMSEIGRVFTPVPQILKNVKTQRNVDLSLPSITQAIHEAKQKVEGTGGRLLVRPSGTEPLIRIMAQGDNRPLLEEVVQSLAIQCEQF